MTDTDQTSDVFDDLNREVIESVPNIAELWHRSEGEGVVDLRFRLDPDNWGAREGAIEALLTIRRAYIDQLSINYSFTLPDVAFDAAQRGDVESGARVNAFA